MMTVTFAGAGAVDLYTLLTVRSGIKLYLASGIRPNRLWTPARMRNVASGFTGKKYPASRKGLENACSDLCDLIDAIKEANK